MDTDAPFATVLVGQPTLRHRMKLGTLAALDQRITVRRHMTGMTAKKPPDTFATTSSSPAARTHCSPTTPSS